MAEIVDTSSTSQQSRPGPAGTTPVRLITASGNEYIVHAAEDALKANQDLQPADSRPDGQVGHPVNWPPENVWRQTDEATRAKVHVQRYELRDDGKWFWIYRLTFFTNKAGTYRFQDGRGDVYEVVVYDTSTDHVLDYNSASPTIVYVWWTE